MPSTQPHHQTTFGRNRFFCWPALWHQPSSFFKRPLAETDFFAGPPCGSNPVPSSTDPWPKPMFLLARLVALTQLHPHFFAGPPCGIGPFPSLNSFWPNPIFLLASVVEATQLHPQRTLGRNRFLLLARLVASTQLHPQRTLGRNRFFAGPPCGINLAEIDFFAGPPCGINPAPSSNDFWPKPIF